MILLIFYLTGLFMVIGTGVLAAWSDFKGLTIPNSYSLIVIVVFFVTYGLLWAFGREDMFFPFLSHILAALIIFGVTMGMFALNAIGAADSKLATAFALWVGLKGLFPFLFFMSLFGGVLGIGALILKKYKPLKAVPAGTWLARVQGGENKVPYGIAIVLGALASFVNLGYFRGEVFTSFLM